MFLVKSQITIGLESILFLVSKSMIIIVKPNHELSPIAF